MGNACCSDATKGKDSGHTGSLGPGETKLVAPNAIKQEDFQTKITPQSFNGIKDKDQLLQEVLLLIANHGDLSTLNPINPHLKQMLAKIPQKVSVNGNHFEGETIHGIANGKGKVVQADGVIYEGTFANGRQQGEGVLHRKDQTWSSRTFYKGKISGLGEHKTADGTKGILNFVDGLEHGPAIEVLPDQSVVHREFQNGQQIGQQLFFAKAQNVISLASVKNGQPVSEKHFKSSVGGAPSVASKRKATPSVSHKPAQGPQTQPVPAGQHAQQANPAGQPSQGGAKPPTNSHPAPANNPAPVATK